MTNRTVKPKPTKGSKAAFATLDHDRHGRCGFPEFVYGAGKSADQLCAIVAELKQHPVPILCTRVDAAKAKKVLSVHPDLQYCSVSEVLQLPNASVAPRKFRLLIVTAGTSDLRVALEAQHTAQLCGLQTELISDVGVAGIQRLLDRVSGIAQGRRHYCHCRHGRRVAECDRRPGCLSGDCGADQRWLRRCRRRFCGLGRQCSAVALPELRWSISTMVLAPPARRSDCLLCGKIDCGTNSAAGIFSCISSLARYGRNLPKKFTGNH